jgi:hypothetical protein
MPHARGFLRPLPSLRKNEAHCLIKVCLRVKLTGKAGGMQSYGKLLRF